MNSNNIIIRNETLADRATVEKLVRESFWNVYRPGCYEHYLLHIMRDSEDFVPELNFVMEKDGEIIGQNVFVNAEILADDGRTVPIMTMGPICIRNDLKRQGYGKILLDYSLEKATGMGVGAICFEGNIDFYGKSGFRLASEFGIRYYDAPVGEETPFFLCKELQNGYLNGVTGKYYSPKIYLVEDEDAEKFDRNFPPKEKLKLEGQIF